MALVAIDAVVDVTAYIAMIGIGVRLGMAVRALEHGVVARVRMTGRAHAVCVPVVRRKPRVIEGRVGPTGRRVTGRAGRRESCRHVVRAVGSRVVRFVTAIAVRGNGRVVVVQMTARTRYRRMGPSQRK